MHITVATAGHVDHGKSSLVAALTGTHPDRLAEERRRGLTIDLGFAHRVIAGAEVSFVDVPGHVRFLKNMLAGVGAVDTCLFVVAATEAWKPQSEEHLRILELLGMQRGLVALTKVDLVDDDHRQLARFDVEDHLAGSFLAQSEIIEVSSTTGEGLDALSAALGAMVSAVPITPDRNRPRLWIDRVFAARGAGTVVTGTLAGGPIHIGDQLDVVRGNRVVRVRGLQSAGASHETIEPGRRVAVNLSGIAHDELRRGDALVRCAQWRPTRMMDCSLQVLESVSHVVSRRGAHLAYIGSGEWPCRIRVLGSSSLQPGSTGLIRLHLPETLALVTGDRFIVRESGRSETIGGGEVLDVAPRRPASKSRPDHDMERVVAEHGFIDAEDLEALTGQRRAAGLGRFVADPTAVRQLETALTARLDSAGPLGLALAVLDEKERLMLARFADVVVSEGTARRAAAPDPLADHPYVAALAAAPWTPPGPGGVDKAELRALVRKGLVVERDGVFFHPDAISAAAGVVAGLLESRPDGFTVAELRDQVGSTRKHVLPLVAELDARGITRRRGDLRIAGPRISS
jgi:selenocysteine-specific elongation factor